LFHICPSALIKWMFSIAYGSGPLTPEFLQLCLGIVTSTSRGCLEGRNPFSAARAT
jgi:hypothetical protein